MIEWGYPKYHKFLTKSLHIMLTYIITYSSLRHKTITYVLQNEDAEIW